MNKRILEDQRKGPRVGEEGRGIGKKKLTEIKKKDAQKGRNRTEGRIGWSGDGRLKKVEEGIKEWGQGLKGRVPNVLRIDTRREYFPERKIEEGN